MQGVAASEADAGVAGGRRHQAWPGGGVSDRVSVCVAQPQISGETHLSRGGPAVARHGKSGEHQGGAEAQAPQGPQPLSPNPSRRRRASPPQGHSVSRHEDTWPPARVEAFFAGGQHARRGGVAGGAWGPRCRCWTRWWVRLRWGHVVGAGHVRPLAARPRAVLRPLQEASDLRAPSPCAPYPACPSHPPGATACLCQWLCSRELAAGFAALAKPLWRK